MFNDFNCYYLAFIIVLLLMYHEENNRKKVRQLIQDKVGLQNANKEYLRLINKKDLLLKEIHHRVKNNLQLIISLISVNIESHHKVDINDVLKKVESRIIAMAIIHHKLCEEEKFTKLDMQDYLEKLIENIKESYQLNNIEYTIYSKNICFDLDTAIPLGLIINEMLCNSIKHAFDKADKGTIKIIIKQRTNIDYTLFIGDNGKGICSKSICTKSIGMELIYLLVKQINGSIKRTNTKGTNYIINFQEVN